MTDQRENEEITALKAEIAEAGVLIGRLLVFVSEGPCTPHSLREGAKSWLEKNKELKP
jgi:hypothetical protein